MPKALSCMDPSSDHLLFCCWLSRRLSLSRFSVSIFFPPPCGLAPERKIHNQHCLPIKSSHNISTSLISIWNNNMLSQTLDTYIYNQYSSPRPSVSPGECLHWTNCVHSIKYARISFTDHHCHSSTECMCV